MYPFIRLVKCLIVERRKPAMTIDDVHISPQMCWPIDLDIFGEMNNGRILSIYDLGRFGYGERIGLSKTLARNKWGLAVAGASIRYRRRLHMFQKFNIHTKVLGYDERFMYINQTMWRGEEATSSVLLRTAVTNKDGIVPPAEVAEAMGIEDWNPEIPQWAQEWIAAEATRPWPPEY